jgi:hypothetical protein
MDNNNIDVGKAITVGLEVLSDPQVRVPVSAVNDLAVLKGLLISIRNGELVLASPDRILPKDAELPKTEVDN